MSERETFMGRLVMIDPPMPATPVVPSADKLIQEVRDELLFCQWFGELKEHLDGERMDQLCRSLGLPEVGVSMVALDAVLRACAKKAETGKILP